MQKSLKAKIREIYTPQKNKGIQCIYIYTTQNGGGGGGGDSRAEKLWNEPIIRFMQVSAYRTMWRII